MKSFIGKAASVGRPNFPSTAALFTPLLFSARSAFTGLKEAIVGAHQGRNLILFLKDSKFLSSTKLNSRFPTTDWKCGDSDEKSENFSKRSDQSSHSSSKSFKKAALALGLQAAGPLNIEDVKTAYRSCALKWHPDLHQASTKAFAEEKFKKCKAAYQSLCDQLSSSSS